MARFDIFEHDSPWNVKSRHWIPFLFQRFTKRLFYQKWTNMDSCSKKKKTEFSGEIWQFWNRFPKMPNLAIEFRSFFYIALHLALLLPLVNQTLLIKKQLNENFEFIFRIYFFIVGQKNTSDLWVGDRFSWIFEFSFIKKSISVCSLIFFWWYLQWICCFISPDRYVPTADLCSVRPSFNPITTVSHRPHQRAPKHQRNSSINVKITLYMTNSPYLHI